MTTDLINYTVEHKLKDGKFNIDNLQHYNLSLQVGDSDFQICVTDTRNHACLQVESYQFQTDDLIPNLSKLFEEHHFLKAGFWNTVKVSFKNQSFSFVPASLFSKDAIADYLRLNTDVDPSAKDILYYKHSGSKAVNVFSVDKSLLNFFRKAYPETKLHVLHQGSALAEGILRYEDHTESKRMFLLYETDHISIVVTGQKKLVYYNRFFFRGTGELLKYIFIAMQELDLDQNSTKIVVWGNLDTRSPVFQELYKYLYNISLGQKPPYIKFGYVFDELPEQRHFPLYSMYLCD